MQCEICLTKAKCRYKTFGKLVDDCEPLRAVLYYADAEGIRNPYVSNRKTDFPYNIKYVFDSLQPIKWELGKFKHSSKVEFLSKNTIQIIWKDLG